MITKQWKVEALDVCPQLDNFTDVVVTVHWRCNANEDDVSGTVYGTVAMSTPSGKFTAFADLTEAQVLGWVHSTMGEEQVLAHESAVEQQIIAQKEPAIITPPLPWATT